MKIKSVLSLSLCMAMMLSVSVHAESRMLGDVDNDGEISITDATVIQRYTVGIKTPVAVTSSVADIDGDHAVTVMDASYLQRTLVMYQTAMRSRSLSQNRHRPIGMSRLRASPSI